MEREEMIRILEELIRDEDTNPTARCTAIRTLREIAPESPTGGGFADLYDLQTPRRKATRKVNGS